MSAPTDAPTSQATTKISPQQIATIARLARLSVNEQLADEYAQALSDILKTMDKLADVNTDGIEPLTNVHDMTQRLRADVADAQINREANQAIAPAVAEGLYLVPQVIE